MSKMSNLFRSVILRLSRLIWLRRLRCITRLTERQLSSLWKLESLLSQWRQAVLEERQKEASRLQLEMKKIRMPLQLPLGELTTTALEDLQMSSSRLTSMLEDKSSSRGFKGKP